MFHVERMAFWSVAQTQPFSESKAKRFLESQEFVCYLPRVQQTQYVRQVKRERVAALFPRYVFVRIDRIWHPINGTPGVSSLLLDAGLKPILVNDRVILDLQSRENSEGLIVLPKKEKFKKGQHVKVISGQFAGQLALYDGMTSRARERVLLQLLGQYVPVELNIGSQIEAASLN